MWACKNGAEFLGLDDLGTFAKGKNPGINVLTQLSDTFELTNETKVRPLNLNNL
jgi:cytosine/adenosine deaminase-related metal-dependent hydrolase